ncbi:hypothetical protein NEUTE1DRAFT_80650 [Neurospora tetrasperma FGSC 2508]|uniref:C2H2-type domain-containing protein n=1 Tax=Neurospora tetrasperma (strain FGSC 2508 / ATCC MYA-4615 / P0657) TaxID=510951 RepID=F8MFH3_NEUT8|nr:uncharacterized protein NEUTE1DRAFT_80650 [Neurospora tetrasperma FGSC 2508]EGO60027.1 hypothetical protein NEUTE1DRAFT_80650 [Neurospora tetrasperma FGSC 2508]EGZ74182.1 hypothetical protein NEUTE2DRAFT_109553 [Neurospora tetrasperma FGSC 2509]
MSSPNTLTVPDEGTRPSSGIVDTNPSRNTAETPVSLSHEGESPSPSQAVTNATPETTYTTTSSSSVTSGVVSDIESSTSLTGTEIMAMRRQRTVNRIMQHFCQYLDWISKGNAVRASTEPFHQTSSQSLPRASLPNSTRCDNIPAVNTELPGPESLENAESLCLQQLTLFDDITSKNDPFMSITSGSRDSGVDVSYSAGSSGEPFKEGRSGECLPDPWTALELPVPATSRDSEDLRLFKNLPGGFLTNHISVPWYPSVLELDDGPEPSTKVNGILHDSTPTPTMHLAVNTMRSEIGRPVNDTNQSNGIRKHAAEDDGDHDGRRKRQKVDDGRKFAYPFFKRNARKYSKWTSCPGPGWEEIHRVKYAIPTGNYATHLYRRHELIQCPRCWSTHKNNKSLVAHLQTDPSCEKQPNLSIVDGVTPEQKEKLLSRKKTHGDMTDEEKWRHMYMILFPDDDKDSIPSPCKPSLLV